MLVKSDTDKLQSCQAFLGSALRTLGEPHIDCANVRIYGGDCLSLMKKLPAPCTKALGLRGKRRAPAGRLDL